MHACRGQLVDSLSIMLATRSERQGNVEDLDEAIARQREALALCPVSHIYRSSSLYNLAVLLSTRFGHRGNAEDLDEAIALHREALALRPVGHTLRSSSLTNLAVRLSARFHHRGNADDLVQAIALQREALALHPVDHTLQSISLNCLANGLSTRFDHRGNAEDLDHAIALHREALALRPVGHTLRSSSLNNLAAQLSTRFDHRGNIEDLDQVIALHREALPLCPVGHTSRPIALNNLANQLLFCFGQRGNAEDLDEAIAFHREALVLCRSILELNGLANGLSARFDHRGNAEDLNDVIALNREALALCSVGHIDRPVSLNDLAVQLSARFYHRGDVGDLNESSTDVYLLFHRSGLDGTGSPVGNTDRLDVAMHHFKAAANFVPGGLLLRLRASLSWVRHADHHRRGTELEAHGTSMQLMDAYMSATASISSRHSALKDFPSTLTADAASCALRSGDVCRAVELLEQGRTIIWTQMTRLRTSLDSLQTHSNHTAALVKRFRDISSLLDKPPASHADGTQCVDVEAAATRYRRLVENWNGVVEEIRTIEGFFRFLLLPMFADLQEAARDGPIIMLIASKSSCDAIIIKLTQPPTSIQLPIDLGKLARLVVVLQQAIRKDAGPKGNQTALIKALRKLWVDVVRPVAENLGGFARRGSRIWWCPTLLFNFLPLHAAGEYRANGESLSQQYISSYTPSLTALMRARRSHDRSPSVPFAAIGQNFPAGASFTLDCVEPELDLVQRLLLPPPTVSFTKITSVDATKSRALRDNTWLHFSCHGTQNFDDPFKSAFLMRDQPLSLLDITQMDLSLHQFAFLSRNSACETAVGDFATPDEVVHLAAGLQFAGVKSVIGTLWKATDGTVQRLVEAFYKNLCGDGKMNSRRAAHALHQTVNPLARDKGMPLDQRIVFMHIGA
ncbi:CHAT domain-containing protein [Suillus occidentalis]|nr:CHAT domain-containing protein [Suillus occidentalis]